MGNNFSLIARAQYKVMPWKNAQGITEEIAISPEGAKFLDEPFLWRLSSAEIQAHCAFSSFPGCDRILSVWKGDGISLNGMVINPGSPFLFAGDGSADCKLKIGPVHDIGIIYDRKKIRANMSLKRFSDGPQSKIVSLQKGLHFLFCASGGFVCESHKVNFRDTLKIDASQHDKLETVVIDTTEPTNVYHIVVSEMDPLEEKTSSRLFAAGKITRRPRP